MPVACSIGAAVDHKPEELLKLIIQIPAFNEEATIGVALAALPKQIPGITSIETLLIDDGSTDATVEAARRAGVNHVVQLLNNRGLSTAFVAGINASLRLGADIIVNTDADNQYAGEDIAKVVEPIVSGRAEVVIGDRDVRRSPHMSPMKKMLQRTGSWAVGLAAGMTIPDVTSGMRAFSREAAYEINVFNPFTYTLETIIQSGNRNLKVESVVVRTNPPTRPSRLYRGIGSYMRKSVATIFRIYALYKPLKTFFLIGSLFLLAGVLLGVRFLYYFFAEGEAGRVQSLILASVFLIVGFHTMLIGLVADLISVNRRLSEEVLIRMKKLDRLASPRRQRPDRKKDTRAVQQSIDLEPAPESAAAEPQWVWLLDEARLENMEEIRPPKEPAATAPPSRRRRRRRGGVRPISGNRERIPHAHGKPGDTPED
jgi:glycosyltransferase involved in cell wall biosynthesis